MGVSQISANMYRGLVEENETNHFVNRTGGAIAKGNVLAVDLTASDGDVTAIASFDPSSNRDSEHPFANAINVAAAHQGGWIFIVALEAAADDEVFEGLIEGVTEVELDSTVAAGNQLMATTGSTDATVLADNNAMIGIALEAGPASDSENGLAIFSGRCLNGASGVST